MEKKERGLRKFFGEFKKFITRGNVVDMAVGVIIGGAFTGIVNGLSNYILKPLINWLLALVLSGDGLAGALTFLKKGYTYGVAEDGVTVTKTLDLANSIYIDWGAFISAIINFLLIAFTLFLIVKIINNAREAHEEGINKRKEKKEERKAVRNIRKELKVSKAEAKKVHAQRVAEAQAAKEEAERVAAAEAEAQAAAEAAAAEEKAMMNTRLLEQIRDLLQSK